MLADPDSPAVFVSWNSVNDFIAALNTHISATGQGLGNMRLPSEAEWEYACRAGTTTRFYWGDDPDYTVGDGYAWWRYNAWDAGNQYAHVVGQKPPNAFGLYDMHGNVWEFCQDYWHLDYTGGAPTDGSAWLESPRSADRVRRGGSWIDGGDDCRSAARYGYVPSTASYDTGFRLAR